MAGKRTEGSGKGGAKAAGKGGLGEVVLLSGGNPQIAKGYGDAPVQAYIAAMPGWKRAVGERLDALVARTVPGVYKAVKWNSPFYGFEGEGWFLSFHCMTKYIKVAFFAALRCNPCSRARPSRRMCATWISTKMRHSTRPGSPTGWRRPAGCRASGCEGPRPGRRVVIGRCLSPRGQAPGAWTFQANPHRENHDGPSRGHARTIR